MPAAPVLKYLRWEVLTPTELELIGRNRRGNFSIGRSCGSNRSLDSYHMTVPQLRQCGSRRPYSLRTTRDRAVIGTDLEQYACGIDINFPARRLRALSKALVELAQSDPPYARDVREIIYSPDGRSVLRWDAERGMSSAPVAGEADNSHLWHTHISQYRSAATNMIRGTAELVIRALGRSGLITAERMQQFLAELPQEPGEPVDVDTEQVKAVQQTINDLGWQPPLLVDGIYGPITTAAVQGVAAKVGNEKAELDEALNTSEDKRKLMGGKAVEITVLAE